jgi:hypothetical protein
MQPKKTAKSVVIPTPSKLDVGFLLATTLPPDRAKIAAKIMGGYRGRDLRGVNTAIRKAIAQGNTKLAERYGDALAS